MVKYTGPKKRMHVPFPADNKLPLWSMAALDEMVVFERGQGVELAPERAEALLKQSPGVFKVWGPPIKAAKVVTTKKQEPSDVQGDQDSTLEDSEPLVDSL
jgi:hypothetical protein